MNIQKIARILLGDIGILSLDPEENNTNANRPVLNDLDKELVALAINGALEEIAAKYPSSLLEKDGSGVLRGPTAATLTATQYSTTISAFATWASWMEGCTIQIDGDQVDNEIVSATELRHPYMGSTGPAKSATVYGDAIRLESSIGEVLEPVRIPGKWPLRFASTRHQFNGWNYPHQHGNPEPTTYVTTTKTVSEPSVFIVESQVSFLDGTLPIFLRVNPMPDQAYAVYFRAKRKPTLITADDIGDEETDPDVNAVIEQVSSVLLPIARLKFTSHPSFSNDQGKEQMIRDEKRAREILNGATPVSAAQEGLYQ